MSTHISVFKKEVIDNLRVKADGIYADLTLGGGGHALGIWEKLTEGKLVAFDIDINAINDFAKMLNLSSGIVAAADIQVYSSGQKTLVLVNRSFSRLTETLAELRIEKLDGVIVDLGWSTDQLNSIPGLAYDTNVESELDMRLDKSLRTKASDLLNALYRPELFKLFEQYADITGGEARRLVDAILEFRRHQAVATNLDLLQIVNSTLPSAMHRGSRNASRGSQSLSRGPHNAGRALLPRVFQALRIAVNDELSRLQSALPQAWNALPAAGVLEVITFHSGEDHIVKQEFAKLVAEAKAEYLFKESFLRPSVEELRVNLRARSAKLRGVRKLKNGTF